MRPKGQPGAAVAAADKRCPQPTNVALNRPRSTAVPPRHNGTRVHTAGGTYVHSTSCCDETRIYDGYLLKQTFATSASPAALLMPQSTRGDSLIALVTVGTVAATQRTTAAH